LDFFGCQRAKTCRRSSAATVTVVPSMATVAASTAELAQGGQERKKNEKEGRLGPR